MGPQIERSYNNRVLAPQDKGTGGGTGLPAQDATPDIPLLAVPFSEGEGANKTLRGKRRFPPRIDIFDPHAKRETVDLINQLVSIANKEALSHMPDATGEARDRVSNALWNTFRPHVEENEKIAEQLISPEYRAFVERQKEFLNVRVGGVVCADGRIAATAIFDPRVGHIHRRLQGMMETEAVALPGGKSQFVLKDPLIDEAVAEAVLQRPDNPYFVEFMGPHIDSMRPDRGCGAAKNKGHSMNYGAIAEYFDEVKADGDKFDAFNNTIRRAGGHGTTFDMTHDSYSQGLIFGLKDKYHLFKPTMSLRQNLEALHNNGEILMTELLDKNLAIKIKDLQREKTGKDLEIDNPNKFAENMILIGEISREITQAHERNGFKDIKLPKHMTDGQSSDAVRALAYHAIRNSVYRVLGGIKPGDHKLLNHPERIIRVGPIGAAFNRESISFIQVTPGELREVDIDGTKALYGLFEGIAPTVGIDLDTEARIIMVTGEFDPVGKNDDKRLARVKKQVNANAKKLRKEFAKEINSGRAVIIGAIFESGTRKMTHVVTAKE